MKGRRIGDTRRHTFDEAAHIRFAEVSGDRNEIHVDPVAARRAITGGVVVHGAHVVLRALEEFVSVDSALVGRVRAVFRKPVFPGDEVTFEMTSAHARSVSIQVRIDDASLVSVELETLEDLERLPDGRHEFDFASVPRALSIEEIEGMAGKVIVPDDGGVVADMFPSLTDSMGPAYVAQLMAVSRLVGMECPGRHSMLSGFDLTTRRNGDPAAIDWSVTRADRRFAAVRIELSGGLVTGHVDSFVLPGPVKQLGYGELAAQIGHDAFAGQRALVVGGSRGLGALTAKLVAAGDGDVVVTWHSGREEAHRLVSEIEDGGGRARAIRMDVAAPDSEIRGLTDSRWRPTHLYYFASPKIFARRTRPFDDELLSDFVAVYVSGFANVIQSLDDEYADPVLAFYPSSVAVDEPIDALTEYSIAKAAGEQAARTLARNRDWLDVVVERLPRVPTDQTATLLPVEESDPVPLMMRLLEEMA